jgi:hypothetical protein
VQGDCPFKVAVVGRNGKQSPARPRIEVRQPASPEEAAAIAAAIEQFMRDTAPPPMPAGGSRMSPWLRAALYAGTGRDPSGPSPWGDAERWGAV